MASVSADFIYEENAYVAFSSWLFFTCGISMTRTARLTHLGRGERAYLYRAVDKHGNAIDFYLSATRNTVVAKRFLGKALRGLKDWEKPTVINTDKTPTYASAIAELKAEGKCPEETLHRQVVTAQVAGLVKPPAGLRAGAADRRSTS